jgi:predicted TIM-barrel fold metal-dependent hydrolase
MMDGPYFVNGKPRRIDRAFIQPPQGNTIYTWTDPVMDGRQSIDHYMAYTLQLTQQHPDRFIGCFVYNPRCGVKNGVEAIERYVRDHGFRDGPVPGQHARLPARPRQGLGAAGAGQVRRARRAGEGAHRRRPLQHPQRMGADGQPVPGRQLHHGALWRADRRCLLLRALPDGDGEAQRLLRERLVPAKPHRRVREGTTQHKILFGSDTPPNEPGMWLRLLEVLCSNPPQGMNLDEETLEDYLGNNVARMIGLQPTPAPATFEQANAQLARPAAPQPAIPLY